MMLSKSTVNRVWDQFDIPFRTICLLAGRIALFRFSVSYVPVALSLPVTAIISSTFNSLKAAETLRTNRHTCHLQHQDNIATFY
ncbi:hypothetical protein KCP78_11205 [Salmonella enterica subsp. enterica]|nr:hypothetical protein KCP78_11205 [Salmonella enterica subsp. enterica]